MSRPSSVVSLRPGLQQAFLLGGHCAMIGRMGGTATLVIRRSKGPYRDRLASYKVLLDDVVIGSVRNGGDVHLVVQPGQHRLRLRVVGKYSPELAIALAAGEVAAFECGPAGSTVSALYQSTFKRNAYITLRRTS